MEKKITKMVTKEVEEIIKREYFCDRCGKNIKNYSANEETQKIVFKKGYGFPEGGHFDYEEAYFCTSCGEKVKTAVEVLGVVFTHRENDW